MTARTSTAPRTVAHVAFTRAHLLPPLVHELAWMNRQGEAQLLLLPEHEQDRDALSRTLPGVAVVYLPSRSRRASARMHPVLKLLRYVEFTLRAAAALVRARPALIAAHDVTAMPAALLARAVRRLPVVYHAHELWSEAAEDNAPLRPLWRRLERAAVRAADRVVAPEPNRARILHEEYGARQLPLVVRNIPPAAQPTGAEGTGAGDRDVHDGTGEEAGAGLRMQLGLPEDARIVLYQGLVADTRCLREAAGAVDRCAADVHLVVIGGGDTALRDDLAARGAETGRVHVLPFLPPAELASLTRQADAGLLLYRNTGRNNYYAAPNKLYEYLFAGLPVIASDFPGLRAIVEDGGFGACADPASPGAIAAAIGRALAIPAGDGIAARARAAFRWEDDIARLFALYHGLTGSGREG